MNSDQETIFNQQVNLDEHSAFKCEHFEITREKNFAEAMLQIESLKDQIVTLETNLKHSEFWREKYLEMLNKTGKEVYDNIVVLKERSPEGKIEYLQKEYIKLHDTLNKVSSENNSLREALEWLSQNNMYITKNDNIDYQIWKMDSNENHYFIHSESTALEAIEAARKALDRKVE